MEVNTLTQLGLGGVIAVLIIREVLGFLAKKRTTDLNSTSGYKSVEYWQQSIRSLVEAAIDAKLSPTLAEHSRLLREIQDDQRRRRHGNR